MGRNAAFGRPAASERLRQWWYAKSRTSRTNLLVGLAVGVVVLVLMVAATWGDSSRAKPPTFNAAQPPTTVGAPLGPLSTVVVGDLRAAGAANPSALPGSTTTSVTSTTTAVAPTVTTTRAPARATTPPATVEPAPATTALTPDVTLDPPEPAPTTVTTPAPPTTPPPTTIPPTTAPPSTTTSTTSPPVIPRPLGLPPLLGPG